MSSLLALQIQANLGYETHPICALLIVATQRVVQMLKQGWQRAESTKVEGIRLPVAPGCNCDAAYLERMTSKGPSGISSVTSCCNSLAHLTINGLQQPARVGDSCGKSPSNMSADKQYCSKSNFGFSAASWHRNSTSVRRSPENSTAQLRIAAS